MKKEFSTSKALNSPPHITLQKPISLESHEESQLYVSFDAFVPSLRPQIILNGFGAFPPKTIYVHVDLTGTLLDFYHSLQDHLINQPWWKDVFNENRPFKPHVTIANRDISTNDFATAWDLVRDEELYADFTGASLCLLRHNGRYWDVIRDLAV